MIQETSSRLRPAGYARNDALLRILLLAVLFLFSIVAHAHTRSYSYSLWELDQSPYQVTVRINQYDLTRLELHPEFTPDYVQRIAALVNQNLQLASGGSACELKSPKVSQTPDGWLMLRASALCDEAGDLYIRSSLLLNVISTHMHFVTVRNAQGRVAEKLLTETDDSWTVSTAANSETSPSNPGSYWLLGVEHILTGWDHLAFVFGLLLLATGLTQLAWLITGFTIAHSITLALAALGHVQPITSAVEALIGLSILLVAMEFAWEKEGRSWQLPALTCMALLLAALLQPVGVPVIALLGITVFVACYFTILKAAGRPERWRLLIAFAFGLIHGFGFAGILAEMSLPDERLLPALFGFNIGVECGQLLVIALFWPLLKSLGKWVPLEQFGTTVIAGLGTFWFITRAFI